MRGFINGLIWGTVVMGAGVAVLSLLSPLAPRPELILDPPQSVAGAPVPADAGGPGQAGADADLVEAAPAAPGEGGTAPDDLSALEAADTEPAAQPRIGGAAGDLSAVPETPAAAGVEVAGDAPVAAATPSVAPTVPAEETGLTVAPDDPAQPALPDITETGSGFGVAPGAEPAPDILTRADPARRPADPAPPVPEPEAERPPDTAPASAVVPETPTDPAVSDRRDEQSPQIAALPQTTTDTGELRPGVGTPVVPLTQREPRAAPAEKTPDPDLPPLARYAASFSNPDGKPLMAIILIDDADAIGAEALREFPYPLTFAVDPAAPGAAAKMARHRAAGFEVVALVDMPAAAIAQDVEVALSAGFATLDETVALLEGTGTGIQGNRSLSDQVTAFVGSTGRGLITQDNGLNTVQKLAVRAGIPSAVVFRDFDGAGQTPEVIRRFLDQAAFRARQDGAVIMLGRIRPDTISALLLWGLQDRASRIALAPVSAVLSRDGG